MTALLREVMYNQPVQLLDSDADNKVADADSALQEVGGDHVAFGYLTTTITVADIDPASADEKARSVERVINGLGFTLKRECLNAVEAWLSSLPGQVYANVRQPLVHTLNLAHMMPLSSVWAGPERDCHLGGPPLLVAETGGSTPFRLSAHIGDVGHSIIVGPTGAGKSVLLSASARAAGRARSAIGNGLRLRPADAVGVDGRVRASAFRCRFFVSNSALSRARYACVRVGLLRLLRFARSSRAARHDQFGQLPFG